jgi:hypothetical protein
VPNNDKNIIWNDAEKSVTILYSKKTVSASVYSSATYKQTKIYLKIGDNTAYVDDKPVTLDAAPIIYYVNGEDRTYLPVKFIAESLGKTVSWNESQKAVIITD